MTKHDEFAEQAKTLYVVHQMSLQDIALELGISTRTLQNWKTDERWDEERTRLAGNAGAYYTELYNLGCIMSKRIRQDEEKGRDIAPARYAALNRILKAAEQVKDLEKGISKPAGRSADDRRAEAVAEIKRALGVR